MARIRKSIQSLDLYKYDVLIEDRGTRSEYFKISQFDGYFYGGRNAFLVAGAEVLRPGTKILVEILNKDNKTVYSAPVSNFIEGNSRLVQVEVYNDTPIGPGKIVLLGCVDTFIDGTPVPDQWKGKYNVRWIADVIIAPTIQNKTPIRFSGTPEITVEEKFYLAPETTTFSQSVQVPIVVDLNPKYLNVFQNGYNLTVLGPTSGTRFEEKHLGGTITGSISFYANGTPETASIQLPITRIFNKRIAESVGQLITTDKSTLISAGIISSSGNYVTKLIPVSSSINVTSSLNLQYNELTTNLTADPISFAKIRLVNLTTLSGEINKVRISYKPTTDPGEYVLLGDVPTNVAELLAIDSGSRVVETGRFNNLVVSDYWYAATMSVAKNETNPTVPQHYNTSSLITTNNFLTNCCYDLLDSIDATPEISSSNTTFKDNVSYYIGTKNTNTINVFPDNEYSLVLDAIVAKSSGSVTLNQSNYSMEVYLVPESGSSARIIDTNPLGQLIGTLTPNSNFVKQNFERVELNFKPRILQAGNYGIRFVAYGGFWNIARVSVKSATEPFFSPDEVTFLIPNVNYQNKLLTFKAEYLDINNNSVDVNTTSLPTEFVGTTPTVGAGFPFSGSAVITGSLTIVDGSGNMGYVYATASYANTASYAEHVPVYPGGLNAETQYSGSISGSWGQFGHINTEYIDFLTTANPTHLEGRVHWTSDTNTLQVDTEVNNFMIELGHQEAIRGKNTTGNTLTKGTLVYINGESGQRPTFATASFDSEARSAITVGMVAQDINDNNTGYAITHGLIRDINTNAYVPGTLLFLSSSGQFTGTAPQAPYHQVRLGFVVTQATAGKIQLIINNGWEFDELHDVKITSPTYGDTIMRSGSLWINTKQLSGSYGITGSLVISGSSGLQVTGSTTMLGDVRINNGSLGVNVAPNVTDGRIDASNDIVAFSSDRRLKTNIKPITDALTKVDSLTAFTFNWNNLANTVAGYCTDLRVVGLYAQDVQKVQPEAVKLAPFDNNGNDQSISGENYLTVQYEKLVPLLIQAIKELNKKIEQLEKGNGV